MEAQRLVLDDTWVQLEASGLETLAATWVTAVEDGQAQEILLRVDVLLAMCREKNILALLKVQPLVDVACLNLFEVVVQNLGHGATRHIGAFLGQTAVGQITAGVLAVSHVHITDDIDDAAIGLLGEAFVLAAVAGLHMENGDVKALGTDDAQTAVRVAQDKHCIRLDLYHELVAFGNDVAHGLAQVVAYGIHVDLRIGELQVFEKDTVEVVVVVLAGMGEDTVEILSAFVDDGCQTDNLRARANDDQQL